MSPILLCFFLTHNWLIELSYPIVITFVRKFIDSREGKKTYIHVLHVITTDVLS